MSAETKQFYSPDSVFYLSKEPLEEAKILLASIKDPQNPTDEESEKIKSKFTKEFACLMHIPMRNKDIDLKTWMLTPVDFSKDMEFFEGKAEVEQDKEEEEDVPEHEWDLYIQTYGPIEVIKFFVEAKNLFEEKIKGCVSVNEGYDFRPVFDEEPTKDNEEGESTKKESESEDNKEDKEDTKPGKQDIPSHLPEDMSAENWDKVLERLQKEGLVGNSDSDDEIEFSNSEEMKAYIAALNGEEYEEEGISDMEEVDSDEEEVVSEGEGEVEEPEAKRQKKEE